MIPLNGPPKIERTAFEAAELKQVTYCTQSLGDLGAQTSDIGPPADLRDETKGLGGGLKELHGINFDRLWIRRHVHTPSGISVERNPPDLHGGITRRSLEAWSQELVKNPSHFFQIQGWDGGGFNHGTRIIQGFRELPQSKEGLIGFPTFIDIGDQFCGGPEKDGKDSGGEGIQGARISHLFFGEGPAKYGKDLLAGGPPGFVDD